MNIDYESFSNAYNCLNNAVISLESGLWNFNILDKSSLELISKSDKLNAHRLNFVNNGCLFLKNNMNITIKKLLDIDVSASFYFNDILADEEFANYLDGEDVDLYYYDGEILDFENGSIFYDRTDGSTVNETFCDISDLTKIIGDLKKFEGNKIVEGTAIKDLQYWVRDDGTKMLGDYVIVATNVKSRSENYGINDERDKWEGGIYDYGDIVETTLGKGIVVDWCEKAAGEAKMYGESYIHYDIYTAWSESSHSGKVRASDYEKPNYAHDPKLESDGVAVIKAQPEGY